MGNEGSDGNLLVRLQGGAEAEMGSTSQSLIPAPCIHVGGNEDVCVCVGRCGGYSLKVESANESSLASTPSCLATSPLHHSPQAPLIYRAIIFSPL